MSEIMPIFETAEDRSAWIRDHATYFTVFWYKNRERNTLYYSNLELARKNAPVVADYVAQKPVMIYAVYCPDDTTEVGLSTWVETFNPGAKRGMSIQSRKNESSENSSEGKEGFS